MTAQPLSGAARELGSRLRELRESHFGFRITQRALGEALGGRGGLSAPLISSWEKGQAIPTKRRIAAYATFFATRRSVEGESLRLLRDDELTADERTERESLLRELTALRASAMHTGRVDEVPDLRRALGGPWHFPDGKPIRIVCTEIPEGLRNPAATPTHPSLPYGELYSYGNLDALLELHGHIRAANPRSNVEVRTDSDADEDDLTAHVVILGGVDWNPLARRIPELIPGFPVRQVSDESDPRHAYFEVSSGNETAKHRAVLSDDDELVWDVGLFVRAPNPVNRKRSLTICCGMYSLGTWAVVRALTDERFRERNEAYLHERLAGDEAFGILMRVLVLNGDDAVTPDWTVPDTRLYVWPERGD